MIKFTSLVLIVIAGCSTLMLSCRKTESREADCFAGSETSRQILNVPATILQQPSGQFYIIERGTIDTRLNPCNLPAEFQVHNLPIRVSGEVKVTFTNGSGPCCTENFFITKISR